MPQKNNPTGFDNSEGNFLKSNALLSCFSSELPTLYLQRYFPASTIRRDFGYAFALALIGYKMVLNNFGLASQLADLKDDE
jgi:adenylosuccinate lyase